MNPSGVRSEKRKGDFFKEMFGDLYSQVVRVIETWEPSKYNSEKKYQEKLVKYLRDRLNRTPSFSFGSSSKITVKKEDGRGLCDVVVDRDIGIELKRNLKTKSQIDRLFGQIDDYIKDYRDVLVVLVGKTDPDALDQLRDKIRSIQPSGFGMQNQTSVKIIDKGNAKKESNLRRTGLFGSNPFGI